MTLTRDQHYVPAFYFKRFFMDRDTFAAHARYPHCLTEECLPPHWQRRDSFVSLFH